MMVYTNRTDNTDKYFKDVKQYKQITHEELMELFKLYRQTNDLKYRDIIAQSNLRFVIRIAKQYQKLGIPLDELIAEGNIGLLKAIDKFNEDSGFKFSSYAVWWIKQSILVSTNIHNNTIKLPLRKNSDPNYPKPDVNYLQSTIGNSELTIIETLENSNSEAPDATFNKITLNKALSILKDFHKECVIMYYGLNGYKSMTCNEIALYFENTITASRIQQIIKHSVKYLHRYLKKNKVKLEDILYN